MRPNRTPGITARPYVQRRGGLFQIFLQGVLAGEGRKRGGKVG